MGAPGGHADEELTLPRHLVDLDRLAGWMDGLGLGDGSITDLVRPDGGSQNVLVRFRRAGREYLLRRPPEHKRANSDETMRREARILAGLAGTDVPHPALIAACPDVEVLGAAFYLMEPVAGFCPGAGLPEPHASDPALRRGMGLAMADGLTSLARIDPVAQGLAGLGRPDGWLERQVPRWLGQLHSYRELDGYHGAELPHLDALARWLEARSPERWTPGLLHGDFHFGNVLVRTDGPELAAILDWELCTIGDPLVDLGQLLAWWPGPGGPASTPWDLPDLPHHDEILERYLAQTDREVEDVGWYEVLACFRLGILLEGTHARACAGQADPDLGQRLHANAIALFERAADTVDARI